MGLTSFSPSPMTTTPSICTVAKTFRIMSTAAWSAAFLSPCIGGNTSRHSAPQRGRARTLQACCSRACRSNDSHSNHTFWTR